MEEAMLFKQLFPLPSPEGRGETLLSVLWLAVIYS
jgi:hypothetical protein